MDAKKSPIIVALAAVVAISGCADSQSSTQSNSKLEVPVGEDAWEAQKKVNITDRISPSTVRLEDRKAIMWENKNSFAVKISIQNVEKIFTVEPGSSRIFQPASGFEYEVKTANRTLGSGKVVTN